MIEKPWRYFNEHFLDGLGARRMSKYTFSVTSKLTGLQMEFEYDQFIKWYDRIWNKAKTLESFWIYGEPQ